jgi:hypothetical protein
MQYQRGDTYRTSSLSLLLPKERAADLETCQLLARQHAGTPQVARWQVVRYSIYVRKVEQADFF